MSQASFQTAFDCLPAAVRLCAQDMPRNVRTQDFAPLTGVQLDVWAPLSGDAGLFPCVDGRVVGNPQGTSETRSAVEFGDGAIERGKGGFLHAPIIDSKTSADSFTINMMRGMTIHERIQAGRLAMKLTAQEFADQLGVTRGAVQQWEKAKGTAPSRKHQGAVANLLGITVPELMNPEPNPGELQAEPVADKQPSENARVLAQLYDMLPDDLIKRTEAYNAATAEIIAVLHGRPRQHAPAPSDTPHPKKNPEKRRA